MWCWAGRAHREGQLPGKGFPFIIPWSSVRKLLSMHSKDFLHCLCHVELSLQHLPRWLKSSVRTKACECEASCWSLRRSHLLTPPSQAICSRHPLQCSAVLVCPLILTHQLSAGSLPITRQTSIHSHCSLTERAHINSSSSHSWLVPLKSLCSSAAVLL